MRRLTLNYNSTPTSFLTRSYSTTTARTCLFSKSSRSRITASSCFSSSSVMSYYNYYPGTYHFSSRRWCSTTTTTETDDEQKHQEQQRKKGPPLATAEGEAGVAFASAASSELVPYVAVSEAFDTAHIALCSATGRQDLIPNFCFAVVSVDHEGMIDAPQAIWRAFSDVEMKNNANQNEKQQNDTSGFYRGRNDELEKNASSKNKNIKNKKDNNEPDRVMLGCVVRNQRVGDGFVEIMLGHIPDLKVTSFTFDQVPKTLGTSKNSKDKSSSLPPCALGFAFSDWKVGAHHPRALGDRLALTSELMMKYSGGEGKIPPLVGAILPPAEPTPPPSEQEEEQMKKQKEKQEKEEKEEKQKSSSKGKDKEEEKEADSTPPPLPEENAPSMYFVNGNVYKGAAGAVLLHSNMLDAFVMPLMPSVVVKNDVTIDAANVDEDLGLWKIDRLGGGGDGENNKSKHTACDYIREIYENDEGLKKNKVSKLFIGLSLSSDNNNNNKNEEQEEATDVYPLTFLGSPQEGHLTAILPPFLIEAAKKAKTVTLVRDDAEGETEAIGTDLVRFEQSKLLSSSSSSSSSSENFTSVRETVMIHRERRSKVTTANACCFHFSHPLLYSVAKPENIAMFQFGSQQLEKHAPSIARRIIGDLVPNSGMHCSGIILPGEKKKINNTSEEEIVIPPQVMPRSSVHLMLTEKKTEKK